MDIAPDRPRPPINSKNEPRRSRTALYLDQVKAEFGDEPEIYNEDALRNYEVF